MGSLLMGFVEGMLLMMMNDCKNQVGVDVDIFDKGFNNVVKDIDMFYLFEWCMGMLNWKKL